MALPKLSAAEFATMSAAWEANKMSDPENPTNPLSGRKIYTRRGGVEEGRKLFQRSNYSGKKSKGRSPKKELNLGVGVPRRKLNLGGRSPKKEAKP
uniref:Uncharacterized protein n=1 Tax=Diadromus pulchellus ascovirus 4a TaxID=158683 RepID=Q9DSW9_9VIRU|nr:hypothetical protein [Diadromus pulchellus ascovirus 4a]